MNDLSDGSLPQSNHLRVRDHEGLNLFMLGDQTTAGAILLDHLNPQTQEVSLD